MRILLINSTFEALAFISERKAIKLLIKDKVDILSYWDSVRYYYANGFIDLPAVIRLKYQITRNASRLVFSRNAVFKRDNYSCGYCGKHLSPNNITMDHIIPKTLGGVSSFTNCVAACLECNNTKGRRPLENCNMRLIKEPTTPAGYFLIIPDMEWHYSWKMFID